MYFRRALKSGKFGIFYGESFLFLFGENKVCFLDRLFYLVLKFVRENCMSASCACVLLY